MTDQEEGILFDMPEAEYRKAQGINISSLKAIGRSPAHYLAGIQTPKDPTSAMVFGSIFHGSILEPSRKLHVVKPEGMSFTSNAGKAWRDSQELHILGADDDARINRCRDAVYKHRIASEIVRRSRKEVSVFKRDVETGLLLKARLDLLMEDDKGLTTVADLKKTDDARPSEFGKKIFNFGYHEQAAYYMDIIGASFFIFIPVEDEAPHAVNVFQLDQDSLEAGRMRYRQNLTRLKECTDSNVWPAYGEEINTVSLPQWALKSQKLS